MRPDGGPDMNPAGGPAGAGGGLGVLEHAVSYALTAAAAATPDLLPRPTPCRGWDLRMLLLHACESVAALTEGFDDGSIGLHPSEADRGMAADPAQILRDRAVTLLGACRFAGQEPDPCRAVISVGGCPLAAGVLIAAGALEIAVHGWDISQACGRREPIPHLLAVQLLHVAPLLVAVDDRDPLFAAPRSVAAGAGPSDKLTAFLGRAAS
jgi:uncharacterized protein (TIGR03086 family)